MARKVLSKNGKMLTANGKALTANIGITPTGSLTITANGTYDVTDKAQVIVNVASVAQQSASAETGNTAAKKTNTEV